MFSAAMFRLIQAWAYRDDILQVQSGTLRAAADPVVITPTFTACLQPSYRAYHSCLE